MKAILVEQAKGSATGSTIQLMSISVETPPTKTQYLSGESFNSAGMVVKAHYGMSGVEIVSNNVTGYDVTPEPLTDGITEATITYAELGVEVTTTTPVTVIPALKSIAVTTNPTTTTYEYGDTLNTTGMVVKATYTNNAVSIITPTSVTPTALNTVTSAQAITVSYTENGITKTTTFNVVVNRKSIAVPTWKGTLTYSGVQQSANDTSLWNNYDTSKMTIGGTYVGTNATSYSATFTLGSNYRWSGGSTTAATVSWSIGKKTLSPTVTGPSSNITAEESTQTVTITGMDAYYTGTITASISPTTGVNLGAVTTSNATTRTIACTGDGFTAGTFTVTVAFGTDSNYNTISNKTCDVTASYFSWTGFSAESWANIYKLCQLSKAGSKDISDYVHIGDTKTMNHTSLLGATSEEIKVIGINYDAANSITFQTTNGLPTTTKFNTNLSSGSNVSWTDSNYWWKNMTGTGQIRKLCQDWASTCDAKDYILTVQKYSANPSTTTPTTTTNSNGSGNVAATNVESLDETGFLPSMAEINLKTGQSFYNRGSGYNEYPVYNTGTNGASGSAYPAYTDNTSRIKKNGDSGSANYWWTRSRSSYYYSSNGYSSDCRVHSDGSGCSDYAWSSVCLAPAAVVGVA